MCECPFQTMSMSLDEAYLDVTENLKGITDLERDRLVGVKSRLYENQIWAFPLGGERRHRRTHAELACFVAGGGDDTAGPRSADCDRLAAQIGVVALFDRCVKGIHVDMDDLARSAPLGRGAFGHFDRH